MLKTLLGTLKCFHIKWGRYFAAFIILAAAEAIANIVYIREIGDMTQTAGQGDTGLSYFLLIIAVICGVSILCGTLCEWISKRFRADAGGVMRKGFAERLLLMPYKDFASKNSGEGASLFTNDLPNAAAFMSTNILSQVSQIIVLATSIVFMLLINWWITLIYFAIYPVMVLIQSAVAAPITKKAMAASEKKAAFNAVVADTLQNPLAIKAYALEAAVEKRYEDSYSEYCRVFFSAIKTRLSLLAVGIFMSIMPTFALFLVSGLLVIRSAMTFSEFISLTIVASAVGSWLAMFSQDLVRLKEGSAAAQRVTTFCPALIDGDRLSPVTVDPAADHAVRFDGVSFGYGDEDTVLDALSFSIEKGRHTAIAGQSGCGKSTVLKLLMGLYTPREGQIVINSDKVAYVPQDCYLFPVSIRQNIVCDLPEDEARLRAACENAGIYDFICGLPQGFDTVLHESAANISGGQKQRIAMARAFYRDADILLLDEATSALDAETERRILEAFDAYVKANGKTAVVISHRESVLGGADKMIRLKPASKNEGTVPA